MDERNTNRSSFPTSISSADS